MSGFPLRYVHQNILVGHGDARAALFRAGHGVVSVPGGGRQARVAAAAGAVGVRGRGRLLAVARVPRLSGRGLRRPGRGAARRSRGRTRRRGGRTCAGTRRICASCARSCPRSTWRCRCAGRRAGSATARCAGSTGRGGASRRCSGSRASRRSRSEIEALIVAEERAFRRAAGCLPVRRATTRELQWLLRRAACRGLGEPALDRHWEPAALVVETADGRPAYEPLECDLVRHANAPILEQDRALVVDAEEGRSHQALLALGALPEESEFPGGAELLFAPLEALAFPVDAVLHARWLGNREAITPRAPADRRRRRRLPRAADLRARAAVVRGRGEPAARARARRLPAVARASAAA